MTELARLREENARLRRIIESWPARPWLETDHPDVVACMGSVPACAEGGCQLRKKAEESIGGFDVESLALVVSSPRGNPGVTVERRRQRDGSSLWCVKYLSEVLNRDGEWEYEPMPSSRDDAFTARCRFTSLQEAVEAFRAVSKSFSFSGLP